MGKRDMEVERKEKKWRIGKEQGRDTHDVAEGHELPRECMWWREAWAVLTQTWNAGSRSCLASRLSSTTSVISPVNFMRLR